MLRNHRGMSLMRRVKAVFWWRCLHAESPRPARDILSSMPTDDDVDLLYRTYSASPERDDGGPEWGDRVVWEELRHKDPYPFWLDWDGRSVETHILSYNPVLERQPAPGRLVFGTLRGQCADSFRNQLHWRASTLRRLGYSAIGGFRSRHD